MLSPHEHVAQQAAAKAARPPSFPAAARSRAAAGIGDLPDALLSHIFELAVEKLYWWDAPASLMLACTRWQRVYLSSPALHAHLELRLPATTSPPAQVERWLLSSCQRLQSVGRLFTSATVGRVHGVASHDVCLDRIAGMLSSLQPPAIRHLSLDLHPALPAGLASWLGGLTRLTQLSLACKGVQPVEAAALGTLSQLCSLHIHTGSAPGGLLGSLLRLRGLSSLQLAAETLPACLEALSQLCQLRVWMVALEPPAGQAQGQLLTLPPPSAFPHLTEYCLSTGSLSYAQVAGEVLGCCTYSAWGPQFRFSSSSIITYRQAAANELALRRSQSVQPLRGVLAALVPPRQALRGLSFSLCALRPAALHGLTALSAVTELILSHCTASSAAGFDAALAALLQHTPQLERLAIEGCLAPQDPFPSCLHTLSGPTFLSLSSNALQDLPEAPCWAGLRSLDLSRNFLGSLPRALATASQLTHLSVRGDEQFQLSPEDVEEVLVPHLPALQTLDMAYTQAWLHSLLELVRQRPQLAIDVNYVRTDA